MQLQTTTLNGKTVKHKTILQHTTNVKFTRKERWKIFFGGANVVTHTAIFTMANEIKIVDEAAVTFVQTKRDILKAQIAAAVQPKKKADVVQFEK